MSLSVEKKLTVAGLELGLGVDAARAEALRTSGAYRRVLQPALLAARRLRRTRPSGAGPAVASETRGSRPAPPATVQHDPRAAEIWAQIADIGWYHTIDLGHGVATPGFIDNRPTVHRFGIPQALTGARCLDIGTYDGFWAFEFERRGATESIGIDVDSPADYDIPRPFRLLADERAEHAPETLERDWNTQMAPVGMQWPGQGFHVAARLLGSKARREVLNVYDLAPERLGMFDLVFISQLLLRLRDPQTVLDNMISVTKPGGCAIVAEGYDPELERLSQPVSRFVGVQSMGIWWSHSIKAMKLIMETAGYERVAVVSTFEAENRVGRFPKVVLRGYAPPA